MSSNPKNRGLHGISRQNDGSFKYTTTEGGSTRQHAVPAGHAAAAALDKAMKVAQARRLAQKKIPAHPQPEEPSAATPSAARLSPSPSITPTTTLVTAGVKPKMSIWARFLNGVRTSFVGEFIAGLMGDDHPRYMASDAPKPKDATPSVAPEAAPAQPAPQKPGAAMAPAPTVSAASPATPAASKSQPGEDMVWSITETASGFKVEFEDGYKLEISNGDPDAEVFRSALVETDRLEGRLNQVKEQINQATPAAQPTIITGKIVRMQDAPSGIPRFALDSGSRWHALNLAPEEMSALLTLETKKLLGEAEARIPDPPAPIEITNVTINNKVCSWASVMKRAAKIQQTEASVAQKSEVTAPAASAHAPETGKVVTEAVPTQTAQITQPAAISPTAAATVETQPLATSTPQTDKAEAPEPGAPTANSVSAPGPTEPVVLRERPFELSLRNGRLVLFNHDTAYDVVVGPEDEQGIKEMIRHGGGIEVSVADTDRGPKVTALTIDGAGKTDPAKLLGSEFSLTRINQLAILLAEPPPPAEISSDVNPFPHHSDLLEGRQPETEGPSV